jgi:hypothetical protein
MNLLGLATADERRWREFIRKISTEGKRQPADSEENRDRRGSQVQSGS